MTKTKYFLECVRSIESAVMAMFTADGKMISSKNNNGRKIRLIDKERRVQKYVKSQNQALVNPDNIRNEQSSSGRISSKTIKKEFHAASIYERVIFHKPLVTFCHTVKRRQ
ncbi:hypothetical protein AVEN_13574-1 [Araneus ventricosus]|uniref:Uncharacterized protein n=1 Tax=Araneus ventricosus TaxID=182803 RepID=A0A4Y2D3R5_ARAVE|nr:hypothetical protein AVEN_13574-1 [Araneus ventricosus]